MIHDFRDSLGRCRDTGYGSARRALRRQPSWFSLRRVSLHLQICFAVFSTLDASVNLTLFSFQHPHLPASMSCPSSNCTNSPAARIFLSPDHVTLYSTLYLTQGSPPIVSPKFLSTPCPTRRRDAISSPTCDPELRRRRILTYIDVYLHIYLHFHSYTFLMIDERPTPFPQALATLAI